MPLFPSLHLPSHAGGANLAPMLVAMGTASAGTGVTLGADVISQNLHLVPPRAFPVLGLYVTQAGGGSGFIAATDAQLAEHPDAVKYGQLPTGDPYWADVLDKESGAATDAEVAPWAKGALASYRAGARPGQRSPAVYVSAAGVTQVANDLVHAGIKDGVGLILANWNLTEGMAAEDVIKASGPFPVVGVQYRDPGPYDLDVWSTAWLNARSGKPKLPPGYDAPKDLKAIGGKTSVRLTWKAPGTPGLPDPSDYEVFIYAGTSATRSSIVPSYPRDAGAVMTWEGGSLEQGRTYTAHVVASGPDGRLVRPFTFGSAVFQTS